MSQAPGDVQKWTLKPLLGRVAWGRSGGRGQGAGVLLSPVGHRGGGYPQGAR